MGVHHTVRRFAAGCLIALLVSGLVHAQEQKQEEQDAEEVLDEIVVVSKKSLGQLRLELWAAEDRAYELFNELNGDDDYDIHCYREAPTGSRVLRRVCRTQYELDATAEEAKASRLGIPFAGPWAETKRKEKILFERWNQLAIERPEFLEALIELQESQQVLESERKRRCEGRILFCQ